MTAISATANAIDHHDHEHPPPPHSSSKRPWGVLGIYTFIGSEIALFGSFFMMYFFIRVVGSAEFASWQDAFGNVAGHAIPVALANSVILFSSSLWIWFSERAFAQGNRAGVIRWMAITMLFGATFLGIQIFEYTNFVVNEHIGPSSNAAASIFFAITGLHGMHVLVGLILLGMMLTRAIKRRYDEHLGGHPPQGFQAGVIYWHFVDVVWVFVLTLLYLV